MFLVVTVDGHVWPCGSRGLMPERRTTVRRPTAQAQIRQLHIVKSIAVYGAANPECGLRTGWASASLRFDRASDNIHRRTLRRGTRWPVRKRYQFLPTRNSGGWAFRLLRDLCQPSTLRGHNAAPHVQAWFARLRELAEGGVKVVRLDILQRARAERKSPDERDKQGKRYENSDDSHVARSAGRYRQETGFWL